MFAKGALLVFGLPRAYFVASACATGAEHCDSQLIQTRVQHEETPKRCFWTAEAYQGGGDSSRAAECEQDCIEQDKVCPFAEGKSCSCTEDLFPPHGEGKFAAGVALGNSTEAKSARLSRRQQVSFVGRRAVAPSECLSNFTDKSTYVVMVMFAGRRGTMQLLLRYLDKMVQQCSVHEVHMWDYAIDDYDHFWVKGIGHKRNGTEFKVMTQTDGTFLGHKWTDAYAFYSSKNSGSDRPRWVPRSELAKRENTVLVKLDDDIVYIDTSRFDSYVEYIRTHHEKFVVHANIVNNGVAAYYQAKHIPELKVRIEGLGEYPAGSGWMDEGGPGAYGPLLNGGGRAGELHKYFLSNRGKFSWSEGDGCLVYGKEAAARHHLAGQGRFSINFFGTRWAQWDNVYRLASGPKGDEVGISLQGSAEGKEQCIFTAFNVAHWGFYMQVVPFSVYRAYEWLSNHTKG